MLMRDKLEIWPVWGKLEIKFLVRTKETEAIMVLCSLRGVGGLIPTFCSCPVKLFPLVCVRGVSCSFSVVQTRVALACSLHTLQFPYTTVSQ